MVINILILLFSIKIILNQAKMKIFTWRSILPLIPAKISPEKTLPSLFTLSFSETTLSSLTRSSSRFHKSVFTTAAMSHHCWSRLLPIIARLPLQATLNATAAPPSLTLSPIPLGSHSLSQAHSAVSTSTPPPPILFSRAQFVLPDLSSEILEP